MQRRTFFVGLASASGGLSLAGCSGTNENDFDPNSNSEGDDSPVELADTSDNDPSSDGTNEGDTSEDETTDELTEPDPITVEGDSPITTDPFDLIGGFVAVDMEYAGYDDSAFRVRLIDEESGDSIRELADETGEWSGEVGETFDAGSYRLDVQADGEWSIEVRQPRPTDGDEPPIEDDCKTSTVLGPYKLDGKSKITATHEGGGNFIVRAHDATANSEEVGKLLIHQFGRFDGTETFSYDGLVWITVVVDGDWEVMIE